MKKLETNIINLYGNAGKEWLATLPNIVEKTSKLWHLKNIRPVKNMSWNYVALATQDNLPVALKISYDAKLIHDEYNALKHFAGNGAIKVIESNLESNTLLLEQAIPGYLLKEHHPLKIKETINIYAQVVQNLKNQKLSEGHFTHVRQWCNAIDRMVDPRIANHFIKKAKDLSSKLLVTSQDEYLCHGDLHLENIIQQNSSWLAIDPKGIIGEIAFEAAAFDLLSDDELNEAALVTLKLKERILQLAKALNINFDRLLAWIFLRIIISAQWFIEDNGDPNKMINLANHIYPLVNQDLL